MVCFVECLKRRLDFNSVINGLLIILLHFDPVPTMSPVLSCDLKYTHHTTHTYIYTHMHCQMRILR